MFKKVLDYAGDYRKKIYAAAWTLLAGTVMQVLLFWFIYRIIRPLLLREPVSAGYLLAQVAAIAVCAVLYAVLYVKGLDLSHEAAYHTLQNLRISLAKENGEAAARHNTAKGVGSVKKMFIDDIESIELLLAHALPEGIANLAVPVFIFIAMFFVDWRLALLTLCSRRSAYWQWR